MAKGRLAKRLGIGCAGLLALILLAALVLMAWKPWAPDIVVSDPSPGGTRVTDDGLLGNYYPAKGGGKAPAVLVLGGSEGGLSGGVDRTARTLAEQGFSALALSYWGGDDQPERMEKLPVETFDTAFEWLKRQPTVQGDRLAVMGASKGGEGAVLVGSRHPELKAVVGYVPSHVLWQGFDMAEPWRMFTGLDSTWSAGGSPLPYVPYADGFRGGDLVQLYRMSLQQNLAAHQDAIIPVEKAGGAMLLVCGEQDTMWPSCDSSRAIEQRAGSKGGKDVTVLAYPQGGHMIFGPPVPADSPFRDQLGALGGTPDANNAAAADSWPKVVAFLQKNLRS